MLEYAAHKSRFAKAIHSATVKAQSFQSWLLDGMVSSNPGLGLDRRAEEFVRLFEKDLSPSSRILDIGGRWGFYADPMETRGHQVTVLDVVRPRFQKTPVVLYDGIQMPFPDQSFDAGLLVTVLHHIPDPEKVIREAGRIVRKKLIVIEDLYHHRLGRWWTVLRDRIYNFEWVGHPCQFRKAHDWVALFERNGFRLRRQEQVYTRLAGLRILNGLFVFDCPGAR